MSRSFLEWRRAQSAWRIEHDLAVSNFPYPEPPKIIYKRESYNPFWERRRQSVLSSFTPTSLDFQAAQLTNFFSEVAKTEETKELALLEKFLPKSEILDTDTLIDKINILMQGRTRYQQLLNRINMALQKDKSSGAPNMSSFFATYLEPELIKALQDFQNSFSPMDDGETLKARYNAYINTAFKRTSTRMANSSVYEYDISKKRHTNVKSTGGGREDWREINAALKSVPGMWELFTTNIKKSIGNWEALYNQLIEGIDVKSAVTSGLKLQSRTFSIGGNVVENAMAALVQSLRGGATNYEVYGGAITSEQNTINDSFVVFSGSSTIDASKMVNDLVKASDQNYNSVLTQTIQQFSTDLENLFGIFINAKNYSIGKEQSASYEKTVSGTFEELPAFLNEMNISVSNIKDFINTAYNTAQGAIADSMRGRITEDVTNALKAAAAKLMFDDYASIGSSQGNLIHLYQFDSKFIPSSVIFRCLAEAIENSNVVSVNAQINLPDSIDDDFGLYSGTDIQIKNQILQKWNEEYQNAKEASNWSAIFKINIKNALAQL